MLLIHRVRLAYIWTKKGAGHFRGNTPNFIKITINSFTDRNNTASQKVILAPSVKALPVDGSIVDAWLREHDVDVGLHMQCILWSWCSHFTTIINAVVTTTIRLRCCTCYSLKFEQISNDWLIDWLDCTSTDHATTILRYGLPVLGES